MIRLRWADIERFIQNDEMIPEGFVDERLEISGRFNQAYQIIGVVFKNEVFIENFNSEHQLQFVNCEFQKSFNFINNPEARHIGFFDCNFNSTTRFSTSFVDMLELAGSTFKRGIESYNLSVREFRIELLKSDKKRFLFKAPNFQVCRISKINDSSDFLFAIDDGVGEIGHLFLTCDVEFSGSFTFFSISIEDLSLYGVNRSGRILFQENTVGSVNASYFTNLGYLILSSPRIESPYRLFLHECNMGKTEVYNIDFNKFLEIKVSNTNLQDIIAANIKWCNKVVTEVMSQDVNHSKLREVYRQLRNVMLRNNDKIEELKFHKLEMNSYYEELKTRRGYFPERFILFSSKWSNNHGLSWTWALGWILFFSLVAFNLNKSLLGYNSFNSSLFFEDAANWLLSINPVRKFSDVYKVYDSGWQSGLAQFIDVFMRIVYSYLIFQFISGFRKYVKK